ncbi:MAG: hypothetical protein GY679_00210 [Mycoplasma sp.]|nr:hypothetical protein [Mycoplasma sp.]
MIKIIQASLRLKLDDKNTTRDIMLELSKTTDRLRYSYGIEFEKEWLDGFNNDIEFELSKANCP